jgi:hypothetical protein
VEKYQADSRSDQRMRFSSLARSNRPGGRSASGISSKHGSQSYAADWHLAVADYILAIDSAGFGIPSRLLQHGTDNVDFVRG